MNNQRNAARRLYEEIANARVPPRCNQDHPLEKVDNDDQAMTNPLAMMDDYIKASFLKNGTHHYYLITSLNY